MRIWGGRYLQNFQKIKKIFFAQIDWKTIQKYNPKVLLVTCKLNGTYFFMCKNFEARFIETYFFYPAVKIASKLFNRFTWMKRYFIDNSIFKRMGLTKSGGIGNSVGTTKNKKPRINDGGSTDQPVSTVKE